MIKTVFLVLMTISVSSSPTGAEVVRSGRDDVADSHVSRHRRHDDSVAGVISEAIADAALPEWEITNENRNRISISVHTTSEKRNRRSDDGGPLEAQVSQLAEQVSLLQAQLQATDNKVEDVTDARGSTYVRWGRSECPEHAQLVYSGRAGGSNRDNKGASPNRLCLPMTPQYDDVATPAYYGRLYGAKYIQIPERHNDKVPCCVCHVPQSSTIMVPATMTCPDGWQAQYTGHLASEDHNHKSVAEFVCLDRAQEVVPGGASDSYPGSYYYYTITVCGTLPCPPYVANKVVTCVVCSK